MEDWKELTLKCARPDEGIFGTMMGDRNYYDFDGVVIQPFGGKILDKEAKKLNFLDDPKTSGAVKWYLEMVKAHATPRPADVLEAGNMFFAGKLASYNSGVGLMGTVKKMEEEGKMFDWDWTLIPTGPAGRGTCTFIMPWCVSSSTRYPVEAYELICLLTSTELALWDVVNKGLSPNGSRKAWHSKEIAEVSPAYAAIADWLEEECLPFPIPWNLRFYEFFDAYANLAEPLFSGEKSWEEQAPIIQRECQEILDLPRP